MKVRFSRVAQAELKSAVAYIADRNPHAASRVRDAILRVADTLEDFPLTGTRVGGLRRLVSGNYLIFYEVKEREVVIARVIHGARLSASRLSEDG